MSTIKESATYFSSVTLNAVNVLLWKKIFTLSLLKIIAASRWSTLFRVQPKRFELSLSVNILIALREIFPKKLPVACIFTYTIMAYLKKLNGTKSLNPKQCLTELSHRFITQVSHFLPKMSSPLMLLCCTHQVSVFPPSLQMLWQALRMGYNPTQQPKVYSLSVQKKNPLINLHLQLSKVSFLSHQIAVFMWSTYTR